MKKRNPFLSLVSLTPLTIKIVSKIEVAIEAVIFVTQINLNLCDKRQVLISDHTVVHEGSSNSKLFFFKILVLLLKGDTYLEVDSKFRTAKAEFRHPKRAKKFCPGCL